MMQCEPCIGFLEFSSIAVGIEAADALLKKASVALAFSYPVSSGKYITLFHGSVEDVQSSLAIGREVGRETLVDSFLLPNVHPAILVALAGPVALAQVEALGIVETASCASCIEAADRAVKTSTVQLIKIRLAQGIGGKAYFVLSGEVGDVETALFACLPLIKQKGLLVRQVLIPQAHPDLLSAVLGSNQVLK